MAEGQYAEYLKYSLPTFMEYCFRHGYDFVETNSLHIPDTESLAPSWAKVYRLKEYMYNYEYVLWVDADALILDNNFDLADAVNDLWSFQGIALGDRMANCGVWIIRRQVAARLK
jgi:hypothetical protein